MGFQQWMERRRQRKLDDINREIEALKQHGLGLHNAMHPKGGQGMKYLRKDSSVVLVAVIVIAILSLGGLSLLYHGSYKELNQKYTDTLAQLEQTTAALNQKEQVLNKTSSELSFKKEVEKDLSQQYTDLEEKKTALEAEIADLQSTVTGLKQDVDDMQGKLDAAEKQVGFYKDCITDTLQESLSSCS